LYASVFSESPSKPVKPNKPIYSFGYFLPHALRWLVTASLLVVFGLAVYIGIRFYHIDNQVARWWLSATSSAPAPVPHANSLPLHNYQMDVGARVVAGVDRNLSGLAFNSDRQQLIAVINRPATLLTMDLEGRVLSRHRLHNASDIEGVAYLGNNRIAMTEEGRSRIIVTDLPAIGFFNSDMDLRHADSIELDLGVQGAFDAENRNAGFEGLGYDQQNDHLYVAKEHSPRALYRISGIGQQIETGRMAVRVEDLGNWLSSARMGTDLSSVDVMSNGHLLLLSDESQSIVELNKSGEIANLVEIRDIKGNNTPVPQPEGLALGPDGTLYMISEPNLFYRLSPHDKPV